MRTKRIKVVAPGTFPRNPTEQARRLVHKTLKRKSGKAPLLTARWKSPLWVSVEMWLEKRYLARLTRKQPPLKRGRPLGRLSSPIRLRVMWRTISDEDVSLRDVATCVVREIAPRLHRADREALLGVADGVDREDVIQKLVGELERRRNDPA